MNLHVSDVVEGKIGCKCHDQGLKVSNVIYSRGRPTLNGKTSIAYRVGSVFCIISHHVDIYNRALMRLLTTLPGFDD